MPPPDIAAALDLHPLVAEVLWQRGCRTEASARAFLDPDAYTPASPFDLPDMQTAALRLRDAIANREHIRVWGDFDVDGQTATSVLLLGLRSLGANVDYVIPNRATHSHGLNKAGIQRAKDDSALVLLTCDCGVTDFDEIAFARRIGLDVIVSDHHDLAREGDATRLPDANAVVNPKRLPSDHPMANLPGVGVAYKLIEAVVCIAEPVLPLVDNLLDLVAIGIIADVAYQRGDTRYLLQRGLAQLRSHPRPGVRALLKLANIDAKFIDSDSVGFQIGPRLNAAGRLDTAELSVELLTAMSDESAAPIAARIERLNNDRRALQKSIEADVFAQLERDPALTRHVVIVLQSAAWHPSVIGVVANAVVERFRKPAILIAGKAGEIGRGSARSVDDVDIHAAILSQRHLIENGGGHPMAAGFGIRSENVEAFRVGVSAEVSRQIAESVERSAVTDMQTLSSFAVAWRDANLALADQIERLAPFGAGNPRPLLFSENMRIARTEPLGKDGKHQSIYLQDEQGNIGRATWWRSTGRVNILDQPARVWFTLRRNVYQGIARAQIEIVRIEQGETDKTVDDTSKVSSKFRIVDLRGTLDRVAVRDKIKRVYGEKVLIITSAPPGPNALRTLIERASPQTVVLLSSIDTDDNVDSFIKQLLGMIKMSRERGDTLDDASVIERMATKVNQREETIKAGIDVWQNTPGAKDRLRTLLEETRSYRKFFQEAPADEVLRIDQ
jgi:single-stranded-DNA-specific exonuclease